jgi:hypothetical protein
MSLITTQYCILMFCYRTSTSVEVAKIILWDPPASSSVSLQSIMLMPTSSKLVVCNLVEIKASIDRVLRFLTRSKVAAECDHFLLVMIYFCFVVIILSLT